MSDPIILIRGRCIDLPRLTCPQRLICFGKLMGRLAHITLRARFVLHFMVVISVAALWIRSHHFNDGFYTPSISFVSYRGTIRIEFDSERMFSEYKFVSHKLPEWDSWWRYIENDMVFSWRVLGTWHGWSTSHTNMSVLCVPDWIGLIPCLLYAINIARRQFIHRLRLRKGLCRHCGYDLRKIFTRCPECGHHFGDSGSGTGPIGG